MTNETTADQNRRTHARRVAFAANRAFSAAFGELEGLVGITPEHQSELRQMTYDIARMQKRVEEIAESTT